MTVLKPQDLLLKVQNDKNYIGMAFVSFLTDKYFFTHFFTSKNY